MATTRFRVNSPPVIHQTLDGEVIVVNLDTGTYYSLVGTGAAIWGAVERGATVAEAVEEAVGRYEAPRPVVEPAVARFVDELVREELVVAANGDAPAYAAPPTTNGATPASASGTFDEPRLDKYTDMQELLLLDPIHEVDERGWPNSLGEAR
jgi:hypothetical protein